MYDDDFAPTHVRADFCDAADEAEYAPANQSPVSAAAVAEWEEHPWF